MYLEPDILECEVKWALENVTTNKATGSDGIPVELFQILLICIYLIMSDVEHVFMCLLAICMSSLEEDISSEQEKCLFFLGPFFDWAIYFSGIELHYICLYF